MENPAKLPVEFRFPFFSVQTFGRFPINDKMTIRDYLRGVYGRGEYRVMEDFVHHYLALGRGVLVHVKRPAMLGNGLWDYFFIATSLSGALQLIEEKEWS